MRFMQDVRRQDQDAREGSGANGDHQQQTGTAEDREERR
jgi:hypothetical protein